MLKDRPRWLIRRPLDRPMHRRAPNAEFRDDLVVEGHLEMQLAVCGGALRTLHEIVEQEGDEA